MLVSLPRVESTDSVIDLLADASKAPKPPIDDSCCYVCADDASSEPLLSDVCSCRSLCIHASCQQQVMRATQAHSHGVCAVCKTPYNNVAFRWKPELKLPCDPCDTEMLVNAMIIPMGFHSISDLLLERISLTLLPAYALLYGALWLLYISWESLWQVQPVVTTLRAEAKPHRCELLE